MVRDRTEETPEDLKKFRRRALLANIRHAMVQKQDGAVGEIESGFIEEDTDPFDSFYIPVGSILKPPFSFANLYQIYEEGDVLAECVDAMIQNIDGFGYQLLYLEDDVNLPNDKVAEKEFLKGTNFFDRVNDEQSFTTIRKLMRGDLEIIGNGTFEIVRNNYNSPTMMFHIPFRRLRMTKVDKEPVRVTVNIMRDGRMVSIPMKKHFRRFCQISAVTGLKLRWYKQFGDPRILDAKTGEYVASRREAKQVATEILHFKVPFGDSPYGIPRWIQVLLDIKGRRSSQYVNWDLFENQGIPALAILVQGGVLTDESLEELETVIRSMRGTEKFNRIMILEANPETQGLEDRGSVKIEIKPLAEYRKEDQMFTKYLDTSAESIRHRYRLPPLYVGWACVTPSTETLTESGWKYYWEVDSNEKIATINPKTHRLEYQKPIGGVKIFDYEGKMIHFKNTGVDMEVTPNHEMYFSLRRGASWQKQKAGDIFAGKNLSYNVLFKAAPLGEDRSYIKSLRIPLYRRRMNKKDSSEKDRVISMDEMLLLTGLYLGDGCLSEKGGPRYHMVLGAHKKRKIKIFKEVGEKFAKYNGVKVTENTSANGYFRLVLSDRGLVDWLDSHCGRYAGKKAIPKEFLRLNQDQSELLLKALIVTDGSLRPRNSWNGLKLTKSFSFSSTSKCLAEGVQLVAFRCGFRSAMSEHQDARLNKSLVYTVNIVRRSDILINNSQCRALKYSGKVYCFEVPNHLFITRRNGCIGIHGNSTFTHATSKSAKEVAEEQIFVPARSEFDEVVDTRLLPELGITKWKFSSKGPMIVGAEEISAGVTAFDQVGAFTVNHAISMANTAYGLQMSKFKEPWGDMSFGLIKALLSGGLIPKGMKKLVEELPKQEVSPVTEGASKVIPVLPEKVPQKLTVIEGGKKLAKKEDETGSVIISIAGLTFPDASTKELYEKFEILQRIVELVQKEKVEDEKLWGHDAKSLGGSLRGKWKELSLPIMKELRKELDVEEDTKINREKVNKLLKDLKGIRKVFIKDVAPKVKSSVKAIQKKAIGSTIGTEE